MDVKGYLFLSLALALNAGANILLKVGALRLEPLASPEFVPRLFTNYTLLTGLGLFALNVVFYAAALTRLNLSVAYPVMTAGAILIVVTASLLFLIEGIRPPRWVGVALVVVGGVLVSSRWPS